MNESAPGSLLSFNLKHITEPLKPYKTHQEHKQNPIKLLTATNPLKFQQKLQNYTLVYGVLHLFIVTGFWKFSGNTN